MLDVKSDSHAVTLFAEIRGNAFTRLCQSVIIPRARTRVMTKSLGRLIIHDFELQPVIKAGVSPSLFRKAGDVSVWKFDNISLQILHGRDKSCKTPGTSLKIPNFIAAVKSNTLREFGIALSGIRLATRKKACDAADLSSGKHSSPKHDTHALIRRKT